MMMLRAPMCVTFIQPLILTSSRPRSGVVHTPACVAFIQSGIPASTSHRWSVCPGSTIGHAATHGIGTAIKTRRQGTTTTPTAHTTIRGRAPKRRMRIFGTASARSVPRRSGTDGLATTDNTFVAAASFVVVAIR